jgi:6-phosphogluconolactonase
MQSAMRVDVHPTDADAVDAAAALVAEHLSEAAAGGRATAAVGGGRSGRAPMVALAGRGDLPWPRVEWFLTDERCGPADDPLGHARIARDSLFAPRGVQASRIHAPSVAAGSPEAIASAYADALATALGPALALDVVLLAIGGDGALGAIAPGSQALAATAPVAVVGSSGAGEPARVTMTPALLARARRLVVTAVGPGTAVAVRAALRDSLGPAACVLPSERVTWILDRAAATELLRDATAAGADPA